MAEAKRIKQTFAFVVVIDFEATCERDVRDYDHEIIEWPAVLIDLSTAKIVDHFHRFVTPTRNPQLTAFCTELTGIEQKQVSRESGAKPLKETMQMFHTWLAERGLVADGDVEAKHSFAFATDGPWDFGTFLSPECASKGIDLPSYFQRWVNIRWLFAEHHNKQKRLNVEKMLAFYKLTFEGRQHSGLDDTKNIARIVLKLVENGCVLRINDGLSASLSVNWKAPTKARDRKREAELKKKRLVEAKVDQANGKRTSESAAALAAKTSSAASGGQWKTVKTRKFKRAQKRTAALSQQMAGLQLKDSV